MGLTAKVVDIWPPRNLSGHLDWIFAGGLAIGAFVSALIYGLFLPPELFNGSLDWGDAWYGADNKWVIDWLSDEVKNRRRTVLHPFAQPLTWGPSGVFDLLGFDAVSLRLSVATYGSLTAALIYAICRPFLTPLRALLVGVMFLSSGHFIFWWTIVETFPIGAATILIPPLLLVYKQRAPMVWGGAVLLSFGATITNAAMGALGLIATFGARASVLFFLKVAAVLIVLMVGVYTFLISFPEALFSRLLIIFQGELRWLTLSLHYQLGPVSYLDRICSFWLSSVVTPAPQDGKALGMRLWITTDSLRYGLVGWISVLSWLALLGRGIQVGLQRSDLRGLTLILLAFLGFQLMLHMVYGDEPFLYSAHFGPVLILLAGLGLAGPGSRLVMAGAIIFIITALINNIGSYLKSIALLEAIAIRIGL